MRVCDAIGEAQEEGEEAVAVVERPPYGFVGGGGGAFAVQTLTNVSITKE